MNHVARPSARSAAVRFGVLYFGAALLVSACGSIPSSIKTPQGAVAYRALDLIDALGAVQHAAITANTAGALSEPTTRKIVKIVAVALQALDAAIDAGTGQQAVYKDISAALAALQAQFSASESKTVGQAIVAAQAILVALQGGSHD